MRGVREVMQKASMQEYVGGKHARTVWHAHASARGAAEYIENADVRPPHPIVFCCV